VGQASSLSIWVDGQDARPTGNPSFSRAGDCSPPPAMAISWCPYLTDYIRKLSGRLLHGDGLVNGSMAKEPSQGHYVQHETPEFQDTSEPGI
jgi:hypothetical protein